MCRKLHAKLQWLNLNRKMDFLFKNYNFISTNKKIITIIKVIFKNFYKTF